MTDEPPSCDLTIEPVWAPARLDLASLCEQTTRAVRRRFEGAASDVEVSFSFVDDATIAALNGEWRGRDRPTDVLSFPADDADTPAVPGMPRLLGDVVVAYETCTRDAAALDRALVDHVRHLLVHGLLHLHHFDHQSPEEAALMEGLEIEILDELGVPDPYAGRPLLHEEIDG